MELWSYSSEGIVPAGYFRASNFLSILGGIFGLLHIFENQIMLGFHFLLIEAECGDSVKIILFGDPGVDTVMMEISVDWAFQARASRLRPRNVVTHRKGRRCR